MMLFSLGHIDNFQSEKMQPYNGQLEREMKNISLRTLLSLFLLIKLLMEDDSSIEYPCQVPKLNPNKGLKNPLELSRD